MLVHFIEPHGILHFAGFRIYGSRWGRRPVDIPFALYKDSKTLFQDATYRSKYLSEKFGRPVDEIAFTVNELRTLPWLVLWALASQMGVLKRRGPRNDLKCHDVPKRRVDLYAVILKALQDVT